MDAYAQLVHVFGGATEVSSDGPRKKRRRPSTDSAPVENPLSRELGDDEPWARVWEQRFRDDLSEGPAGGEAAWNRTAHRSDGRMVAADVDARAWGSRDVEVRCSPELLAAVARPHPAPPAAGDAAAWARLAALPASVAAWVGGAASPPLRLSRMHAAALPALASYADLLATFPGASALLRDAALLHIVAHLGKELELVERHDRELAAMSDADRAQASVRDHGFERPRVLILSPMRSRAAALVERLLALLPPARRANIRGRRRFRKEYGGGGGGGGDADGDADGEAGGVRADAPEDFRALFAGNVDDNFRLGIRLRRAAVDLFADFYKSDVLVASPLGLRVLVGAAGDAQRDFDFLNSLQIVLVDAADVLEMQNWDHVDHIFDHMNRMPKRAHRTDISRLRPLLLRFGARSVRQTILLAEHRTSEQRALLARRCFNSAGLVQITSIPADGVLPLLPAGVDAMFERVDASSVDELDDVRLRALEASLLVPWRAGLVPGGVLLVCATYFDYVQVRDALRHGADESGSEGAVAELSEYCSARDTARARQSFASGRATMLLTTFRFHFYHRYVLKGATTVVLFGLPQQCVFFLEYARMARGGDLRALYSAADGHELERVVGRRRAQVLLSSSKRVFTIGADE